MKNKTLIMALLLLIGCTETAPVDTVKLSKTFIQAVIEMDEKTIDEIRHDSSGGFMSTEYALKPTNVFLSDKKIKSAEVLKYTVQKGKTENVECVIVQTTDGRIGNGDNPLIYWRFKFQTDEEKEGLFLINMGQMYGLFEDKGCVE